MVNRSKTKLQEIENYNYMLVGILNSSELSAGINKIYPPEFIHSCLSLCREVAQLYANQEKLRNAHSDSMLEHNRSKKEMDDELLRFRRVGRFLFKNDDDTKELLRIDFPIPSRFREWYGLVLSMWNRTLVNSECKKRLPKMGFSEEYLLTLVAKTESIPVLLENSKVCLENLERITEDFDEKFNQMMERCSPLRDYLLDRFSEEKSYLLEPTGIVEVYSHH